MAKTLDNRIPAENGRTSAVYTDNHYYPALQLSWEIKKYGETSNGIDYTVRRYDLSGLEPRIEDREQYNKPKLTIRICFGSELFVGNFVDFLVESTNDTIVKGKPIATELFKAREWEAIDLQDAYRQEGPDQFFMTATGFLVEEIGRMLHLETARYADMRNLEGLLSDISFLRGEVRRRLVEFRKVLVESKRAEE